MLPTTDKKVKDDSKLKVEVILDIFTQEFESKYSEGIQISDISHLDSEELEVIVKVQILYISIHFSSQLY